MKIIDVVENKTVYEGEITCGDHKVATIECIGAQIFEGVLAA